MKVRIWTQVCVRLLPLWFLLLLSSFGCRHSCYGSFGQLVAFAGRDERASLAMGDVLALREHFYFSISNHMVVIERCSPAEKILHILYVFEDTEPVEDVLHHRYM